MAPAGCTRCGASSLSRQRLAGSLPTIGRMPAASTVTRGAFHPGKHGKRGRTPPRTNPLIPKVPRVLPRRGAIPAGKATEGENLGCEIHEATTTTNRRWGDGSPGYQTLDAMVHVAV